MYYDCMKVKVLIVVEVAKWLYVNLFCSPWKCGWIRVYWDWNGGKIKKRKNWKRWGVKVGKGSAPGSKKRVTRDYLVNERPRFQEDSDRS